jgi:asparagine N-glycosylation enzyme membrane subunit Stt3
MALNEEQLIEERKKKVFSFLKTRYEWVTYVILAFIVFIATYIRTRNLPLLRDVTTGGWTLGPDLDPFLFLRWMKDIVSDGILVAHDPMRYVPLGFNTKAELIFLPNLMALFHQIANFFTTMTVEHSAVVYPVVMFAFTVIAFFFLTRKIFVDSLGKQKSNIIALIASFFLSVIPALLPRTIAGIPEKESTGFLFLFLALYFFLWMWKSKSIGKQITLSVLAGLSTAAMAMVWGGYIYIILTLSIAIFAAFLLGKMDKKHLGLSWLWIIVSYFVMNIFSTRYTFTELIGSTATVIPLLILLVATVHFIIYGTKIRKYFDIPQLNRLPRPIVSLIVSILAVLILALIIYGPGYIGDKFGDVTKPLITPISDRLGVTVAENRQPYFNEWAASFGPHIGSFPIIFWLFFFGSIYLYSFMTKDFAKKDRIILVLGYIVFLLAIIFSRYSSTALLNGTNGFSIFIYLVGILALIGTFGYYYHKHHRSGEFDKLKEIDFGLLIIFSLFFFSIISARGSVRTIMVLVPAASILVGYFVVAIYNDIKKASESTRAFAWIVLIIVVALLIFAGIGLYQQSNAIAKSTAPSVYTRQWQQAMAFVRESVPQNAVFGHWWDYGYWVQSIGERATILDGGNAIVYWNHLMGRHCLTAPSDKECLQFLYTHNGTHFLIDSTDIGKYGAFSSIGSDVNYDRRSYMTNFVKDDTQTQETKSVTKYIYLGGYPLDADIVYENNGSKSFFPAGKAGIGAIIIDRDSEKNIKSASIVMIYNGKQSILPLRYIYDKKIIDLGIGIDATAFIFPALLNTKAGQIVDKTGAIMFLSNRTQKSQVARLYLENENNANFKLIHSEDDYIVSLLKQQGALNADEDFVFYNEFRGPLKIWEVSYPSDIKANPLFLQTNYPDPNLARA